MQKDLKSIFGDVTGLDEKSIQFLTEALVKNNLPGFDYLEFKQSLGALSSLNMDEPTTFKSAFATAATVGLTKDKLIKSAEHYSGILDKEKQQFDLALEKQLDQKVASKKEEVEKLKKLVLEYQAKIQELEAKIEKAQSTIDHADEGIQESLRKIENTKENFEMTFQSIKNQIQVDIDNFNKYL